MKLGTGWSCKRRILVVVGLSLLTLRSLPYLAPIRAKDLGQDDQAIKLRDRQGLPLGTILTRDQNHTVAVPLSQVSPHLIHAILAAEDGRFYQHGALEMRAIARSVIQAIQARKIVSGASTITMQLARMLEPAPRTLPSKAQEIWLSWRLTAGMSKDDILQAYLNRLPMGGNIYGIEAASRIYFGIPAAELNLAQASLLAAIPNNPTYLNPYNYWEPLKQRQQYVLNRMVADGYITPTQRDRAYAEVISLQPRHQGIIAAPHFLFWLGKELEGKREIAGDIEKITSVNGSGYEIQTTIDRPLQQFVEAQVQEVVRNLAPYNAHQGAALVIDNHSGEVLAYVGSVDYFGETNLGRNDGVQALRQPGSTLKPFLYQLALEKRLIRPNTVLADVPTHYAIPGARLYSPSDYSETFQGPVRVRIALANSLNVPAVRVLEKVGVSAFLARLHQLGFKHLNQTPEYYGLGLTLGSGEVSLWELARAYRILANQGRSTPLITTIPELRTHKSAVTMPTSLIIDILSDRHARAKAFGVDSVLNLPFPAAVKTGTSSNFRDTWTVGFTTNYTVATWVGNFNGEPMHQVSGVMGAAPLWQRIMLHLHEHEEPRPFPPPEGMVKRPICDLSGLKPTPACPTVVQEYFAFEDLPDYESHPDTFYQIISNERGNSAQYRLNLPPEYDEWLAKQSSSNSVSSSLKIVSPGQGDRFLVPPTVSAKAAPKLQFKITGASQQSVEWWLNGEKLATNSSGSFFWELRPGNWTLEVRNGDIKDQVDFQVELSELKRNRRGFSVTTSTPKLPVEMRQQGTRNKEQQRD